MIILFGVVSGCFAFASINISRLKSDISTLQGTLSTVERRVEQLSESPGSHSSHPATSCTAILQFAPSSLSSQYWIRFPDGSVVLTFCDMTRSCGGVIGGWTRVAQLDTNQCPSGLRLGTDCPVPTCIINTDSSKCSSVTFASHGFSYSRVCGMIRAYQKGTTDAFGDHGDRTSVLDSNYVDGISLTHGEFSKQHIWTFAAGSTTGTYVRS